MNSYSKLNPCVFSPCRKYRYILEHDESDLVTPLRDYVAWIGLNPSIADERKLDPTLRRILSFTQSFGYSRFMMLNLFALVATDPKVMRAHSSPVGPSNDAHLIKQCSEAALVVCCWGVHGHHQGRNQAVLKLLGSLELYCLGVASKGQPLHPLYLDGHTTLRSYP
jgi:hypothetical protein